MTNASDKRAKIDRRKDKGSKIDIIITAITGFLIFAIAVWISFKYHEGEYQSQILLSGILGMSIGWFLGILATPFTTREKKNFSSIGTAVYGFLTGYVLSKADAIFNALAVGDDLRNHLWVFAAVAITALFTTFSTTYCNRSYWLGENIKDELP